MGLSRVNSVTVSRGKVLTIGPVLLVATCYAIAAPSRPDRNTTQFAQSDTDPELVVANDEPLSVRCDTMASLLRNQLPSGWTLIVREPFVLGSDLTRQELEQHFEQTIIPTSRVLAANYFTRDPIHPIGILVCSSDRSFRDCNRRLDDQDRDQYSGIYSRKHRRLIVNISTGEGTLAHELTHALAHADFPSMPEWFDEGLASLHEECEFSADGQHLIGNENWRREVARDALERGELRMLEDVTSRRFGDAGRAHIDYAHVRSLCLYFQDRGLLEAFYRTCRANTKTDATGLRSICDVAGAADPKTLDDQFRAWLLSRSKNELP